MLLNIMGEMVESMVFKSGELKLNNEKTYIGVYVGRPRSSQQVKA